MKTLAEINFTVEDFAWLRKGLQALSREEKMGSFMAEQYITNTSGLDSKGKGELQLMLDEIRQKEAEDHEKKVDNLVRLQAKLIDFKNFLKQPADAFPPDVKDFDYAQPAESEEPSAMTPVTPEG